jgi:DNA-binding LacI/PurR family transcriptional regulator
VGEFDRSLGGNFCGGFLAAQSYLKLTPAIPQLVTSDDLYCTNPKRENQVLRQWLKQHRPEAILTTEGQLPAQLREIGWRIPDDVGVASTNVHDMEIDAGIDQLSEAVGRIGVEMLVKQINVSERGEPAEPCRILVESRWQDGKSMPRRG